MSEYRFETLQVHAGQETPDSATDARAVPVYLTTSYVFKDCATAAGRFGLSETGNIYSRIMNPTSDAFEQRIAALEGGVAALATASGAAAVTYAIQNTPLRRPHRLRQVHLRLQLQPVRPHVKQFGVETTFVDGIDPENFAKAIRPTQGDHHREPRKSHSPSSTWRRWPRSRTRTASR